MKPDHTVGAALIGSCLLGLAASPVDGAELGPTSSASVQIRVSVAPRYALKTAEGSTPGSYCIASNGPAPAFPVELVRQGHDGTQTGRSRFPIASCQMQLNAGEWTSGAPTEAGTKLLLVHPE